MLNLESFYQGKKVLVTGATGFKGSWLCIWLLKMGAEVYGYSLAPLTPSDNFVTTGLIDRINHIEADIRNLKKLSSYISKIQPEVIFHLAAQPLVIDSYKNPINTFSTNTIGVANLFESVRKCASVKAIVNVTTDKCYQNNEWEWGYRENDPLGGDDPYSASKACAEIISNAYRKSFFKDSSCSIATARAGNVIGGGDWSSYRLIPDIFKAHIKKEQLEIRSPYATRPWQFVLEPLLGYLILAKKLYIEGEKFEGAWNFGPYPSKGHTVLELLNELKKYWNYQFAINQNSEFKESNFLSLDISKSMKHLAWKPILNFKNTIQFTVEGYFDHLNTGNDSNKLYLTRLEQINKFHIARKK